MRGYKFWVLLAVLFIIVASSAVWSIGEANKCAAKGGAYIAGQGTFPACVQGVK